MKRREDRQLSETVECALLLGIAFTIIMCVLVLRWTVFNDCHNGVTPPPAFCFLL